MSELVSFSNFRGSPHPLQTLMEHQLSFMFWVLALRGIFSLFLFFSLNSTRSHVMKALQFTGENLVRGCSCLRFSWRNVCFFLLPNTIKCSFGKSYFTIVIIIIQMKFRSATILLAVALAVFKSSGRKAFIQFAIRQIFLSCLPAVWVQYIKISVQSMKTTSPRPLRRICCPNRISGVLAT